MNNDIKRLSPASTACLPSIAFSFAGHIRTMEKRTPLFALTSLINALTPGEFQSQTSSQDDPTIKIQNSTSDHHHNERAHCQEGPTRFSTVIIHRVISALPLGPNHIISEEIQMS